MPFPPKAQTFPKSKDFIHQNKTNQWVNLRTFLYSFDADAWTPDNDGPDSGLNADLLDDYHASDILNVSNFVSGLMASARARSISFKDTQDVVPSVGDVPSAISFDFKRSSVLGITDDAAIVSPFVAYQATMTITNSNSDVDGATKQIATGVDYRVRFRLGTRSSGWQEFNRIWNTGIIALDTLPAMTIPKPKKRMVISRRSVAISSINCQSVFTASGSMLLEIRKPTRGDKDLFSANGLIIVEKAGKIVALNSSRTQLADLGAAISTPMKVAITYNATTVKLVFNSGAPVSIALNISAYQTDFAIDPTLVYFGYWDVQLTDAQAGSLTIV